MAVQNLLRGVSPVLEVPFLADGEVDLAGFATVVERVFSTGVTSVLFPGFASEFYKLSESERAELLAILLARTNGGSTANAIVAVQDHATKLAADRAVRAAADGADMINLLPPYFLTPGRFDVLQHIRTVLAAVAPLPVVVQFAPTETGTSLAVDDLRRMAAELPNLVAVKVESMPPGKFIADLSNGTPCIDGVEGYAGVQLPDAFRRGAVATQPGCSFIEIYVEIWARFQSGDFDGGVDLHRRLLPYISYWMLQTERIIAAEKTISCRRGWFASDHCRAPAFRHDAEDLALIDRFLEQFADFFAAVDGVRGSDLVRS